MYSFNITILGEGHPLSPGWQGPGRYYNPPSPCGEGPRPPPHPGHPGPDFNPPSPCGEGLEQDGGDRIAVVISIHPPRVGRDRHGKADFGHALHISIHPPRVGRDAVLAGHGLQNFLFQSTLPVWGGTCKAGTPMAADGKFQSTLPVWGGTRPDAACSCKQFQFQSTLPVWGGTGLFVALALVFVISIHPPRVGRDRCFWQLQLRRGVISIHPPRVGRDRASKSRLLWALAHFNPPSPCGEGRIPFPCVVVFSDFNPPSPCGEGR